MSDLFRSQTMGSESDQSIFIIKVTFKKLVSLGGGGGGVEPFRFQIMGD